MTIDRHIRGSIHLNGERYRLDAPVQEARIRDLPPDIGSGNQPARVDMSLAQHWVVDDFTPVITQDTVETPGGFGLESVRNSSARQLALDSHRFWDSTCDTRFPKQVTLGPLVTTLGTLPSSAFPTRMYDYNGSLYLGTRVAGSTTLDNMETPANWTASPATDAIAPTLNAITFREGAGAMNCGINTAATGSTWAVYTKSCTPALDLSGRNNIRVWVYLVVGTLVKLHATVPMRLTFETSGGNFYRVNIGPTELSDGDWKRVSKPRSGFTATGNPSWSNITLIYLEFQEAAAPVDVALGDIIVDFLELVDPPMVRRWNGTSWDVVLDDLKDNGDVPVFHFNQFYDGTNNYLYAWPFDGYDGAWFWRSVTGNAGTWAQSDNESSSTMEWNGTLYKLDTGGGVCVLQSCAGNLSPLVAGNWATTLTIREAWNDHGVLAQHFNAVGEPTLYIGTTFGVIACDILNTRYYQPIKLSRDDDNCKAFAVWPTGSPAGICYGLASGSIECYNPEDKRVYALGPNLDSGLPATRQGICTQLIPLRNWLVALIRNGTTSAQILVRGRQGGWHMLVGDLGRCETIHYSDSFTPPRLLFGDGAAVKYITLPDTTDNPYSTTTAIYRTSDTLTLPTFEGRFSEISKTALEVRVVADALAAQAANTEKITVEYNIDGAGWTTLGTVYSDTTDGKLQFASGNGLAFKKIDFRLTFARGGTNTNTPRMRFFAFKYGEMPTPRYQWAAMLNCIEEQYGNTPATAKANLETAVASATLVDFYPDGDASGTARKVKVIEYQWLPETMAEGAGGRARLVLAEVA